MIEWHQFSWNDRTTWPPVTTPKTTVLFHIDISKTKLRYQIYDLGFADDSEGMAIFFAGAFDNWYISPHDENITHWAYLTPPD